MPTLGPLILLSAFLTLAPTCLRAEVQLLSESSVAEKTLTFADGPAAKFSTVINGRTHQQSPLTTYRGHQYVTYFDSDRRLCLGRRKLPDAPWQIIQFKDHLFQTNDSHNSTVLGICDRDGTIHLAFDHHATPLNYRVSQKGLAHHPETQPWKASLFGPVQHSLGSLPATDRVTYPRFFPAPNGNLMLYYRSVTSANGDGMIEEYDGTTHSWTPSLGKFIARDQATFTANGKTSEFRCPYVNHIGYAGKRLHVSWVWRDRFEKTHPRNQHDLCYAYSDDHGRSWKNSAGQTIGHSGNDSQKVIHLNSPGLVVAPIPVDSRLSNQTTHYAYPDGSLHVIMLQRSKQTRPTRYHHHWRNPDGSWHVQTLRFSGDRPKILGDKNSLLLIYSDNDRLHLVQGLPNPERTRWTWTPFKLPKPLPIFGDAVVDFERWEHQKVLSVYGQKPPTKEIRTKSNKPVNGHPTPLHVTDYRLPTKNNTAK